MKAPDKIYLLSTPYRFLSFWYDYESPVPDNFKQTEYIRKEVLLEWAKGEIMPGNSAEGKGWNLALQTLIEKLESL